jgi:UDP-N-acetylglucosamine--N-acetylmuramyl-(pentapeptide) pyrophosphoryl-undecaprenol N-acetylglucosamine transferase
MIPQKSFTPIELAKQMQKLAMEPGALENAARRAGECGRPNAVRDMADLIESFGTAPITTAKLRPAAARSPLPMQGVPA